MGNGGGARIGPPTRARKAEDGALSLVVSEPPKKLTGESSSMYASLLPPPLLALVSNLRIQQHINK